MNKNCEKGYHYHPKHPKADASGCMKDDDMGKRENYRGAFSIYNAVRSSEQVKLNDTKYYIGI
jgi:hypothetical protein